jgi:hypothetical protein
MHEELLSVAEHIKGLGLAALAHGLQHTLFADDVSNPYMTDLAVLQAAHAAELLIKARIAEQHPLLIFKDIPESKQVNEDKLSLRTLIESKKTKTLQYSELPGKLWATTGYKINEKKLKVYEDFGKLRNTIQHFTSPAERDLMLDTLNFVFSVIDPMINDFWGLYTINYFERLDAHNHVFKILLKLNIPFLIPDDYKEVVEVDRLFLERVAKTINYIKEAIGNSQTNLHQIDKANIVNKIQSELGISSGEEQEIYWEAFNTLLLEDESYLNWRIQPL